MRKLSRRATLLGSAAVVATAASGPVAVAVTLQPIEPLMELERQWRTRLNTAEGLPDDMPWEDRQPYFDAVWAAGVEIHQTPAQSFAGLAAKLRLYAHHAGLFSRSESWGFDWQDELMKAAIRDAERLAGEVVL